MLSSKRILILEDEYLNQSWMRDSLSRIEGVTYVFVRTYEELVSAFEAEIWDCFLLDHRVPGRYKGDSACHYLISEGVSPTQISTISTLYEAGYPEGIFRNSKRRFKNALSDLGIIDHQDD